MVLLGLEAQQLATYIGWLMHKTSGGVIAGVLFILPLAGAAAHHRAGVDLPRLGRCRGGWRGFFMASKPAVAAIVLQAAPYGSRALKMAPTGPSRRRGLVAIFALERSFSADRPAAALVGFIGDLLAPDDIRQSGRPPCAESPGGAAIIDDTTPIPAHAIFQAGGAPLRC
ncbi:hypothetical protein MJK72_16570 [Klebsiella pneumoniae]|nr:hypothetical protein MJK72_16570 [Klebsiella pneumoniae]